MIQKEEIHFCFIHRQVWLYCEICCNVICEGVMYKEILDLYPEKIVWYDNKHHAKLLDSTSVALRHFSIFTRFRSSYVLRVSFIIIKQKPGGKCQIPYFYKNNCRYQRQVGMILFLPYSYYNQDKNIFPLFQHKQYPLQFLKY